MLSLIKPQNASANDINVSSANELPSDSVSSISWIPNTNSRLFAAASWDSKVRLYDTVIQGQQAKLTLKGGIGVEDPCLSVAWCEDDVSKIFAGSVNGSVKVFDVNAGKGMNIGAHDSSVKSVYWVQKANCVLSLSHDKTIRFWDMRQAQAAAAINLGYKVYCSDFMLPYLAIGLNDEKLVILDISNLQALQNKSLEGFESPLGKGSQLTTIAFTTCGGGIGFGSHDGRANVSKFGIASNGKLKLDPIVTFKTKKYDQSTPAEKQILYPVHDVGFNPLKKDCVFTAGGEGAVTFWDFQKRDKLKTYDLQAPVTRTKVSPDGLLMAYALGYDWSLGITGYQSFSTKVCVHVMQKSDLVK